MKKISFKDTAFGWDGLTTFIFSNVLLLVTLGLFFFYLLFRTMQIAITSKIYPCKVEIAEPELKTVLVAGLCLIQNQVTEEFKVRLNRAQVLYNEHSGAARCIDRIIILGGLTGENQISEAQAGADFLIKQGVDAKNIILEDQSRHTLENMQHARALLLKDVSLDLPLKLLPFEKAAIITSRYHLYRVLTLANGLRMSLQPVAAEESLVFSIPVILSIIKEAYYLHWYWSGKLWVFITANHKSKARIT